MKSKLLRSLKDRIEDEINPRSSIKFLKELAIEDYIDSIIAMTYLYSRPKKGKRKQAVYFTEIASALGHNIRTKAKMRRDSASAIRTGAFILYSFEALGLLEAVMGASQRGHSQLTIKVVNEDALALLWNQLTIANVEKLPSETPYASWMTSKHMTGVPMVKTGNRAVLDTLTSTTHPIVFDCVNKAQRVGWTINKPVYDIQLWALRNKADAFAEIWELANPEAKATKLREAKSISDIAKRFMHKTFYHLYTFDFRGRKYPTTAYLHEQGSDLARGLLRRADKSTIGKPGFFWLLVSIASNWAGSSGREDGAKTDKVPLQERYSWVLDNEEIILSYAENPKVNQNWMKADKPWQFLAACFELMNFRIWQGARGDFEDYSYESHLECYIDGSNNGSQHLSALTRDEITAPHVNLVPLDLPGDLYKYVGDHVWERFGEAVALMSKEDFDAAEHFIATVIDFKKQINIAEPKGDLRTTLIEDFKAFKDKSATIAAKSAPVFWSKITDAKQRRKIVKR